MLFSKKKQSAEDKFCRMFTIMFLKWCIWSITRRPKEFAFTIEKIQKVMVEFTDIYIKSSQNKFQEQNKSSTN